MAGNAVHAAVVASCIAVLLQHRRMLRSYRRLVRDGRNPDDLHSINAAQFWPHMRLVSGIAVRSWRSTELLGSVTFVFLFALKAVAGIARADADGQVVEAFVGGGDKRSTLARFVTLSFALATVTGLIEHLRFWLIARYRATLTKYFHENFFDSLTFYRAIVLDDKLQPGTTIATYCHEFAEHFAELPYYFILPAAEACAALFFLYQQAGAKAATAVTVLTLFSLVLLRWVTPRFGQIHTTLLEREERFRSAHTDVKAHVEQLALHRAGHYMRSKLDTMFGRVYNGMAQMAAAKGSFTIWQSAMSLGFWDVMALGLCARMSRGGAARETVLRSLLVQRQIIRSFHESVERLIDNLKEASHLYEFTEHLATFDHLIREARDTMPTLPSAPHTPTNCRSDFDPLMDDDHNLVLDNVTITTPADVELIRRLSLTIRAGDNWVILGPNGCGKTSILRILAGLWQPDRGTVTVSPRVELNFLPQAAFLLSNATLFEQLAFPEVLERRGQRALATPTDIGYAKKAMSSAFAETIVQLLGGWSSPVCGFGDEEDFTFQWESLSGGQQQKLALARLFFRAQTLRARGLRCFAMLDESTSQIDIDSEDVIFAQLAEYGITYASVTHRERVIAHHDFALVVQPASRGFKVSKVRADKPARTESDSALVNW